MRVLYWTNRFWPFIGGVQLLGAKLLPQLRARGFEFEVVCNHGDRDLPDEDELDGIAIHRFHFYEALAVRDIHGIAKAQRRIAALKAAFRPDLVHLNLCDPGIFFHLRSESAQPAATLITVRVSLTQTEAGPDTLLGRAFRSANWITANSGFVLEGLRKLVPEIQPRSSVIYNGLEAPSVMPEPLPLQPPTLVGLGRLVPEKGFDLAIAAFARIARRFPEARLIIGGDGPSRSRLEELARNLGVEDRVWFPGWIPPDGVPAFLNTATVVLMPSRWQEAFGLVALQAAQMARPVVATRVGGLPEVIADGETGLVVQPEDPDAMADAVAQLLTTPGRATAMGLAGRARAERMFSWSSHVDAYDALYRRLGSD